MRQIHAAVGVTLQHDKILIAQRPGDKILSGFWEFPGGKIEPNETAAQALVREFQEEVNITPTEFQFFTHIEHTYPDRTVFLDAFIITAFTGNLHGKEGQPIVWVTLSELEKYEFLPANQELLQRLKNHWRDHPHHDC